MTLFGRDFFCLEKRPRAFELCNPTQKIIFYSSTVVLPWWLMFKIEWLISYFCCSVILTDFLFQLVHQVRKMKNNLLLGHPHPALFVFVHWNEPLGPCLTSKSRSWRVDYSRISAKYFSPRANCQWECLFCRACTNQSTCFNQTDLSIVASSSRNGQILTLLRYLSFMSPKMWNSWNY